MVATGSLHSQNVSPETWCVGGSPVCGRYLSTCTPVGHQHVSTLDFPSPRAMLASTSPRSICSRDDGAKNRLPRSRSPLYHVCRPVSARRCVAVSHLFESQYRPPRRAVHPVRVPRNFTGNTVCPNSRRSLRPVRSGRSRRSRHRRSKAAVISNPTVIHRKSGVSLVRFHLEAQFDDGDRRRNRTISNRRVTVSRRCSSVFRRSPLLAVFLA